MQEEMQGKKKTKVEFKTYTEFKILTITNELGCGQMGLKCSYAS